jgi:vitamin B12 transporter
MNARLCTALAGLAVLPSPRLVAQADRDTVTLRPVVVTATRLPLPADAVSVSVTVIRGQDLAARGVRTVADALRDVLGAAVARAGAQGGQTSLFLRGGESDYVKVLVDGVPVNQPGGAYDFAHLTTDAVERIELVRGPVSVLYGSDAVTGVVQVFTRTGTGRPRASLELGAGSRRAGRLGAALDGPAGDWRWAASAARSTTDGVHDVNDRYENTTAGATLRLAEDARTTAALTARWRDAVSHFPTDGAGRPVDANQMVSDRGPILALDLGRRLSATLEARLLAAWHDTEQRYDDAPDGPGDTLGVYAYASRAQTRRTGLGARLVWRPAPTTAVTGGAEFERQRLRQSSDATTSFGSFRDALDTTRLTAAYFVEALGDAGRRLALSAGARLEDNERFGRVVTWRAGASWRVAAATRVRVAAGTGFKEPTFIEQYGGAGTVGDPDLRPERSRSWEVGFEQSLLDGRVTLAAVYFDQQFTDLVEYTFTPAPPDTVNYFNVGGARADGVEATVTGQPATAISVTIGYTLLSTRVTDPGFDPGPGTALAAGERLLRRPAHAAFARLAWAPTRRVSAGAEARWVGGRDDLDFAGFPFARVRLAAYALVGLSAAVDLSGAGRPGVVLRARADNLFDTTYEEVRGFRTPGRTLFVGAEARFPS